MRRCWLRGDTRGNTVDPSPSYEPVVNNPMFINKLKDALREALSETTKWIAQTHFPEDPISFQFMDVVQLCLLNYRFRSDQEANITAEVSYKDKGHGVTLYEDSPSIDGQHFRVFDITMNNVISNAVKHSGLGLRSKIVLELIDGDGVVAATL
jgi:hypothetical protein